MRVLVCGGRDNRWAPSIYAELGRLHAKHHFSLVITGGARGVDEFADYWARRNGVDRIIYCPDWEMFGRAAGPIRNKQMLNEGQPELVIAFPGGRGTADMVRQAEDAGVAVHKV